MARPAPFLSRLSLGSGPGTPSLAVMRPVEPPVLEIMRRDRDQLRTWRGRASASASRLTPLSRKPGFSGKSLSAKLREVGIAYRHEADLGNPPDNRNAFRRGHAEEGRQRMRRLLSSGARPALQRVVEDARRERVAILCVERSRLRCHRQVVTDMIQEIEPTVEVVQIL